jgi:hypothetical protein
MGSPLSGRPLGAMAAERAKKRRKLVQTPDFISYHRSRNASRWRGASLSESKELRVQADFNGLFGKILCLSHADTCLDEEGNIVTMHEGMAVTAFDEDADAHGNRDDLIASGTVEPSPEELRCLGSRWILRIDEKGVRHESESPEKS